MQPRVRLFTAILLGFGSLAASAAEPFPRSTYRWPFASGPVYGEVDAARRRAPGVLHTMVGSFDLKRGSPALPPELRAAPDSPYAILQVEPASYADGRFDRVRQLLENRGGVLLEAMAVSAHLVRMSPSLHGVLRSQDGVLALEPYHPAFKLAPTIGRVPLPDPALAVSHVYALEAVLFRGEIASTVASLLKGLGATITKVDPDVVYFEVSRDRLAEVARIDAVKAVFESVPNFPRGEQAAATVQTGSELGGLPYTDVGVRGDGQVLMVLDSGLQLDAGDLSDTRTSAGTPGPDHRKVLLYTPAIGGTGDALGCDAVGQGGFTHGHVVAATALGNASDVPSGYGPGWPDHGEFGLDGIAPGAKLILYDAHVTPSTLSCADPMMNALSVGTLYTGTPGSGSLGDAYARGARVSNFSWATSNETYGTNAQRIDQFLLDQPDAMVFVSAGEDDPATCKNCTLVTDGTSGVFGNGVLLGAVDEDTVCTSSDNDQNDPVQCDALEVEDEAQSGTSYAAAKVSGAALLVRDWFAQGFYPDGTSTDAGNAADQVPIISGSLLKAVLITSANYSGGNYRTDEFGGYGYVELKNALPLSTYALSPAGMRVSDGGLPSGGRIDFPGLPGSIAAAGTTQTGTLRVESDGSELRCALAWTEEVGSALAHDLHLELVSPSGKVYTGNFFNESLDGDWSLDPGENCIDYRWPNWLDYGAWSIPTNDCPGGVEPRRDAWNSSEGIFLSPDPVDDGIDDGTHNQIEVGDWTIKVIYRTGTGSQRYAVSCSGPIATESSARFGDASYLCTEAVQIVIQETVDPDDPSPSAAEVASRTIVQVLDESGVVRDSEAGSAFAAGGLRFESTVPLTSGTAYDPGNGVLDARHGDKLRVIYADETSGVPDPAKVRIGTSEVACRTRLIPSPIAQFGRDTADLVQGGCERDARGLFTFGFPDQHLDAGETLAYRVAFQTDDGISLRDVEVSLRCVDVDADSPADCRPGTEDCPDPDRLNNPSCTQMTILDSPRVLPLVLDRQTVSASFTIRMATTVAGTPKVEMLVGVSAPQAGRSSAAPMVFRHVLDADDVETFYSTDYPTGGVEVRDFDNSETEENPTTNPTDPAKDYLFETRTYGDLTAGGTRNTSLQSPWSFDGDDGGFRVGQSAGTSVSTVTSWGEDTNFNGILDPAEDRDPVNGVLDRGWNTKGGCGWQSRGGGPTGGIWHTGTIRETTLACADQCVQAYGSSETLLLTPVIEKVNRGFDGDGDATHHVAITNWAWHANVDLRSSWPVFSWELDLDAQTRGSVDLFDSAPLAESARYSLVFVLGTLPGPVFAPASGNGTVGNNRAGKNWCMFVSRSGQRFPRPPDDDANDDGDALIDEYVRASGPIRNFDALVEAGFDYRYVTLEDLYGEAGNSFQGALGYSAPAAGVAGYGVGVDDMVLEWKEISVTKDTTDCAGACATLSLESTNAYEGNGVLTATVIDASPWEPVHPVNDCNWDGDYLDPGDDQDCNDNGTVDVTVRAISDGEPAGEVFALDRTEPGGNRWKGDVPFSVAVDVPGVLYLPGPATVSSGATSARVRYEDRDDGTGQRCGNAADVAQRGFVEESTLVRGIPTADISVGIVRLTDSGDNDGFADPNETVSMFVTLRNNTGLDRHDIVVRLSSNDPNVDCILGPVLIFGDLAAHETRESTQAFTFRVANVVRSSVDTDLTATFTVAMRGDDFDSALRTQRVTVDLDLNVSGGLVPTSYSEGFEAGGFGSFTSQSLDAGRESLLVSNGHRCQYNDPDFQESNSYGNTFCYLGAPSPAQNAYDWHVHTPTSPDGGRAYLGNSSLHWGRHPGAASADTTGLKQLDAIRTINPVNLGWNGVVPELSFKHQVGLTDCDYISCSQGYGVDRGVVYVQLANSAGTGVGHWRKISPYENVYDSQATDNYTNCLFDPTDDGNTEDDYFDPTDPARRLGPSSTCMPEFAFTRHGAIAFNSTFNVNSVGHADGPGLQGVRGPGTWVQTKFSLDRYRGRRVRIRFLATSIEISNALTMEQALDWNPTEADDGWYIDDVRVTNTLTSAATVTVDTADRTGLPGCGPICTSVSASLAASPPATAGPGQLTDLDASASLTDRCSDGILQFRFWSDGDGNGVLGDAGDAVLRTWAEDPILTQVPNVTTRYGVEVRCSSLPSCLGTATTLVTVSCPSTGNATTPFDQAIGFSSKTQLSWPTAAAVDVIRGDLGALRSSGGQFDGTVEACMVNDQSVSSVIDATLPAMDAGKYYLVREAGPSAYCNATPSWKTGVPAEAPGAGGDRDADLDLDPDACP